MQNPICITRRACLTYAAAAGTVAIAGCTSELSAPPLSLKTLMKRDGFGLFVDVIFPSHLPWLTKYRPRVVDIFNHLQETEAEMVAYVYQRFESQVKCDFNIRHQGNIALAALLKDPHYAPLANQVLDLAYKKISFFGGLDEDMWGRPPSLSGYQCFYWDNYDEPVDAFKSIR